MHETRQLTESATGVQAFAEYWLGAAPVPSQFRQSFVFWRLSVASPHLGVVMIGSAYDGALQELVTRLFLRKLVPFLGAGCSVGEPSRMPVASGVAQLLIDRGAGTEGQALEDIAEEAWARGGWQEFRSCYR